MKKITNTGLIVLLSVGLSLLIGNFTLKTKAVAWADLPKVFNDFEYKKELEKNYIKSEEARKKIIDSLELELQIFVKKFEGQKNVSDENKAQFQIKRENYLRKKDQFEQDNAQMKSEFNAQIYKQLSQYAKDFGKEKGYAVVLGAEGSGVILYGEEANNVTEQLLVYINNKYKGISK